MKSMTKMKPLRSAAKKTIPDVDLALITMPEKAASANPASLVFVPVIDRCMRVSVELAYFALPISDIDALARTTN